jgi:DNA-binding FrmR family transcriptional regulator
MLDNDIYCIDILMQTQAAKKALEAFMRELLNDHINTCVAEGIRSGNEHIIDELTDVLYKLK